jgi:hypothetical protein
MTPRLHLCGRCRCYYERTDVYFHANCRSKDGLASWCKGCMCALSKEHEAAKRARLKEQQAVVATLLQTAKAYA